MIKRELQQKTDHVVVDITCDICGRSTKTDYGFEFARITAHWGYMSNKDGQDWVAHVCEKCIDEKLGCINFEKTAYIYGALDEEN